MAKITGFSTGHGHVGYLREAYHGGPYATKVMFPESWESDDGTARLPAQLLKERLPHAIEAAVTASGWSTGTTPPARRAWRWSSR